MQIALAVFGVYHHFELAHQLHQRGHLQKIYSTWPWARLKREGLPRSLVSTFPLLHTTDYLLNRTPLLPIPRISSKMNPGTPYAFDRWTAAESRPATPSSPSPAPASSQDARSRPTAASSSAIAAQPISAIRNSIVADEYRRWKLPQPLAQAAHHASAKKRSTRPPTPSPFPPTVARRSFLKMGIPPGKSPRHPLWRPPRPVHPHRSHRHATPSRSSSPARSAFAKASPISSRPSPRLQHPNKRLTIVGAIQDDIRTLLATLPTDNVVFTGIASRSAELAKKMSASHLLVLPSIEEGPRARPRPSHGLRLPRPRHHRHRRRRPLHRRRTKASSFPTATSTP